ncbi:Permease of the drug/metabolite transporter (DMT) superfamily [Moritella sp. JT01]|uniref:DMT family transporter n=1 Tax=Moritella sp. JT01 TaxID=756698 RepID=UPI0007968527|nr:DMT family transporter [Moritella sp. JT01]KXO07998.1 Permease of the drug/metabolite transporter (DMT) superfamily [Moritella sp. JT01]
MTNNRRADLILVITTILASAGWIFSKEAIQGLPTFGFIGLRFILASILLLPFCYRTLFNINRATLVGAASVGCFLGSAILIWIYAIANSSSLGEGAFIMSLSMLFVPIIAWIFFKNRPPRMFWFSLPFAILGLTLLSKGSSWTISGSQIWFMFSAVMLAIQFNLNSHFAQKMPTLVLTCIQLFVTGVLGVLVSLLTETWPQQIELEIWGWLAMSVLIATSLRYALQTAGQKNTTTANAAIIMILEPTWTVFLSMLWYGEKMELTKLVGCSLILFALIIYRAGPKLASFTKR